MRDTRFFPARLLAFACLFTPVLSFAGYQDPYARGAYGDIRSVVERTQQDLQGAESLERVKGGQRDRYHDAQGHLSTFDRHLVKGHFDKSELNRAIHQVKEVVDKNALDAGSRDRLMQDLQDLRSVRRNR